MARSRTTTVAASATTRTRSKPRPHLLLWLVDDTYDHHEAADATVQTLGSIELEHFLTGADAVATYRERIDDALGLGRLPDVVLMDFYLGSDRGDHVTRRLRELEPARHRAVIVGYSSVSSGSAAIVAAGGDLSVRKLALPGGNPHLADYLRAVLATRR